MSYLVFGSLCFGAGLIVGWNVLPQPQWVQRLYGKAVD